MERVDREQLESRLRQGVPGEMEPPAWVRTRVMSRIEGMPQDGSAKRPSRVSRFGAGVLGAGVLAVIALGVVLWQSPTVVDDTGWESPDPVTMNLLFSTKIRTPTLLQDEAELIRGDVVQLTGLVRVPLSKLSDAVRPN